MGGPVTTRTQRVAWILRGRQGNPWRCGISVEGGCGCPGEVFGKLGGHEEPDHASLFYRDILDQLVYVDCMSRKSKKEQK